MSEISFQDIEKLDCESRYEIFLEMVAEERDIWVLTNKKGEFLTLHSEENDIEYLPIWPHSDFTRHHRNSASEELKEKSVSVPEFFSKWVSGLEGDGLKVAVFPNSGDDIWIMEPSELKADLQEAFSDFSI